VDEDVGKMNQRSRRMVCTDMFVREMDNVADVNERKEEGRNSSLYK
jgi:hypothetical protein